jgi:hypothetical protein
MTEETFEEVDASVEEPIIEEETEASNEPTLEDYQRLVKENQTLKAQKEHFKKKATQTAKETETNKTNTQSGLSREEAILFAKGLSEEDVEEASKIAKLNGVSLIKATEDPYFKFKQESRQAEEKAKGAKLGASSGSGSITAIPVSEMTREQHMEYMKKITG